MAEPVDPAALPDANDAANDERADLTAITPALRDEAAHAVHVAQQVRIPGTREASLEARQRIADAVIKVVQDAVVTPLAADRDEKEDFKDRALLDVGRLGRERDAARSTVSDVYAWLVAKLDFPLGTYTEDKPEWLDVARMAEACRRHYGAEDEPLEEWVALIYAETGWPDLPGGRVLTWSGVC